MRLPRYARNDMRGMRLPRRFTPRDDREDARDDRGTMRSPRRYAPRHKVIPLGQPHFWSLSFRAEGGAISWIIISFFQNF